MIKDQVKIILVRSMIMLISAAMVITMMLPVLACNNTAYASDSTLSEIAAQFQDEDADPFAFRNLSAGTVIEEAQSYPSSFDLRNVDGTGYVTPVKLQNPFGSCWGFSAITSAETSILGNPATRQSFSEETMDLSEKQLIYFAYKTINDSANPQDGEGLLPTSGKLTSAETFNIGGKPFYATSLFACGIGPVMEQIEEDADKELEYHGKKRLIACISGNVYEDGQIPAGEEPFCYSASDDWSISGQWRYYQSYRLKESYLLPTPANKKGEDRLAAINAIKEQLYSKRAVQIGFCADKDKPVSDDGRDQNTKYISNNWAHYTYPDSMGIVPGANHGVSIIGWDDDYPKANFAHSIKNMSDEAAYELSTPEHDGAWLVKNSWGAETEGFPDHGSGSWGLLEGQDKAPYQAVNGARHTGYFWLSYDDCSVKMVEALDFDISNLENEYAIYQHDYMPVNRADSAVTYGEVRMANVFEAEFDTGIEQVTCQTDYEDTAVDYQIYLMNKGAKDPTDGKLLAEVSGKYKYGGFHKEDLPDGVVVPVGRKFSVVVTQRTGDGKWASCVQSSANESYARSNRSLYYAIGKINKGESLLYTDGTWKDLSDKRLQKTLLGENDYKILCMDNFPIKAYTTEIYDPAREEQTGKDGTAFGRGASDLAADIAAAAWRSNKDPKGTVFAKLRLRSSKQAKSSVTLKWNKVSGAVKYVVYGAKSGSGALVRVRAADAAQGTSLKVSKIGSSRIKKGTYYKFMVVALDSNWNVITSSRLIHTATRGGKVADCTGIRLTRPAKAKLSLRVGRSAGIRAKLKGSKLRGTKVKKKIGIRYESTDPSVATVSAAGKVRAVSRGSCKLLIYSQNGLYKTIRITVK